MVGGECGKCGALVFPPRPVCPSCAAEAFAESEYEPDIEVVDDAIAGGEGFVSLPEIEAVAVLAGAAD